MFKKFILEFKARTGCTSADIAMIIDKRMSKRTPESWVTADPAEPDQWTHDAIKAKLLDWERKRKEVLAKLNKADLKLLKLA